MERKVMRIAVTKDLRVKNRTTWTAWCGVGREGGIIEGKGILRIQADHFKTQQAAIKAVKTALTPKENQTAKVTRVPDLS